MAAAWAPRAVSPGWVQGDAGFVLPVRGGSGLGKGLGLGPGLARVPAVVV